MDNKYRTTVEPILNSYFNKWINFAKPFATRILRETNGLYLKILRQYLMRYLHVTQKEKSTAPSCVIVEG